MNQEKFEDWLDNLSESEWDIEDARRILMRAGEDNHLTKEQFQLLIRAIKILDKITGRQTTDKESIFMLDYDD